MNFGKHGERSRSYEVARHPLREKGRELFLERDFGNELRDLVLAPERILVLGSGDGKEAAALQNPFPDAQVVSMDLSAAELSAASVEGQTVCGDWDLSPFPDSTFDLTVFFAALHHAENLDRTLSEVDRILKPGGWVYATHEPMASFFLGGAQRRRMAEIGREEGGIETSPSRSEYRTALKSAGFEEIRIGACTLNRIRLLEMNEGFADVRLRRSDLPERFVRALLRAARPLGENAVSNLIFSFQKLALGLFGVTVAAKKPSRVD